MTRGDARTAVANHAFRRYVAEDLCVTLSKCRRASGTHRRRRAVIANRGCAPLGCALLPDREARLSRVALRSAGIDHTPTRIAANAFDERSVDGRPMINLARIRPRGVRARLARFGRDACRAQALSNRHRQPRRLVTDRAEHPPSPSRRHSAARSVVHDDRSRRGRAPVAETRKPDVEGRKRVPTSAASGPRAQTDRFRDRREWPRHMSPLVGRSRVGPGSGVQEDRAAEQRNGLRSP